MTREDTIDRCYYQVARPGSLAERLAIAARDGIYRDFMRLVAPPPEATILDVGVSDVIGDAANALERKYPYPDRISAVGLGEALAFQAEFPRIRYRRIVAGETLPFADGAFDIGVSNAVLEHVGGPDEQARFIADLVRVARSVFITVPNRFFPVEHHTGVPLLHWSDRLFAAACGLLGKQIWADSRNLILMTRTRLRILCAGADAEIGSSGLRLGPFSSNLYVLIRSEPLGGHANARPA